MRVLLDKLFQVLRIPSNCCDIEQNYLGEGRLLAAARGEPRNRHSKAHPVKAGSQRFSQERRILGEQHFDRMHRLPQSGRTG